MKDRLVIDQTTNTLVECKHHMTPERLDYLVIPHYYNGMQIDHIGPHCFDDLIINLLCIEEGVKSLEDRACENAHILNVKLPRGLKIGERCFADSQLTEILLPRDLHTIKRETFRNCWSLKNISAQFGVNTISYAAFAGCERLKEAHFRHIRSVKDRAFDGCIILQTLDLGNRVEQLGKDLFKNCLSLDHLKLDGSFDKLDIGTFEGACGIYYLELHTTADSLYIPPDCFGDTNLKEITMSGDFEPIVEKRSCFPEDIVIKGYFDGSPLKALSFYFDCEVIT